MKGRFDPVRILPPIVAPIGALLIAVLVSALVLSLGGNEVFSTFQSMYEYGTRPDTINSILNKAVYYYFAAIAAAIGFRMGLFNIGVDGQYRLAVLFAGALGGASFMGSVPGVIKIVLMIVVAMLVGAAWASIAGFLKVTRGVSEVISTIMLNFIAGGLFAWLLTTENLGVRAPGSNSVTTRILEKDTWIPGLLLIPGTNARVYGFGIIAILVGAGYWFMVERTRFGFDLRATGQSATAAVASGINVKRMTVAAMLVSGGVAGLVGLPILFGDAYSYGSTFQSGLGFAGIAIALLGRNHPVGIALGALLFAFLDEQSNPLQILADVSPDIVAITQGVIVLTVVISYEVVRRYRLRLEQQQVAQQLAEQVPA